MPANWKDTSMQDCVEDDTLSTDGHLASDTGSLNPWGKKKKKKKRFYAFVLSPAQNPTSLCMYIMRDIEI